MCLLFISQRLNKPIFYFTVKKVPYGQTPFPYLVDVGQWLVILYQHLGELRALVRVHAHDVAEQEDVVWGVAHFLGVQHDFLELTRLGKALNDFVGDVGAEVHRQGEGGVRLFD